MGPSRPRIGVSRDRSVGRGRDLWVIVVAAAVFSLIATWSMPGFPAARSGEGLSRHCQTSRPEIASTRPGSTIPSSP
jgi:hypothetical protein